MIYLTPHTKLQLATLEDGNLAEWILQTTLPQTLTPSIFCNNSFFENTTVLHSGSLNVFPFLKKSKNMTAELNLSC